ncbi:MAG: hypothetical protein OXN89_21560 [Bryobacterales bacterium]|nr:hypothetical protein [Bryobacterales bacterium]
MAEPILNITKFDAECYIVELEPAARIVSKGGRLPRGWVVCPEGFDRTILPLLPISQRTFNALRDADLFAGTNELTVADLLNVKGIGPRSVGDLVSCLWHFFVDVSASSIGTGPGEDPDWFPGDEDTASEVPLDLPTGEIEGTDELTVRDSARVLRALIEVAQERGTTPALTPEMAQILGTARELYGGERFWDMFAPCIRRIADVLHPPGLVEPLQAVSFMGPGLIDQTAARAWDRYKVLPPESRTVIDYRTLASPQRKLPDLARFLGWTEQQIVECQMAFEEEVENEIGPALDQLARILQEELAESGAVTEKDCARRVESVFSQFESVGHSLVRHFVLVRLLDAVAQASGPKVVKIWGSEAPDVH